MTQLTLEEKQTIQELLRIYVARYSSQNKATNSLNGISAGTVSTILNGKFETISDEMFLRLKVQTAPLNAEWALCETSAFRELATIFTDAQRHHNVAWVVGAAGIGKSTTARAYAAQHSNVFVISCSEDMHRGDFIRELARVVGVKVGQESLREKMRLITNELQLIDSPLLIFDEGDKLADAIFYYFISIYNALEDQCGMVFMSTEYIKRRMELGLSYRKKGYDEIHSRICRRFIDLTPTSGYEVTAICRANCVDDSTAVAMVLKEAQECRFDLRRVKRSIHKSRRLAAINAK